MTAGAAEPPRTHLDPIWTPERESAARQLSRDVRKSRSSMTSTPTISARGGGGPLKTTPSLNSDYDFLILATMGGGKDGHCGFNLHLPGGSKNYSFSSLFTRPSFPVTAGLYLSPLLLQGLFFCFLSVFSTF